MRATVTDDASSVIVENTGADGGIGALTDTGTRSYLIQNVTGTAVVWLEVDDDASEAEGSPFDSNVLATISVDLEPGQSLNGIVASGGADQDIAILPTGR